MPAPIALQLYTVRELLETNYSATIEQIARVGYTAVEYASVSSVAASEAGRILGSFGLSVPSAHLPLPLGEQKSEVLDIAMQLGCHRLIAAFIPPEEYRTRDMVKRTCERLNEACRVAVAHGFEFGYHNHWWEFQYLGDMPLYRVMLEYLDPQVFWELDTYWIATAGDDPIRVVREFAHRAPLLHLKDGPANLESAMVAVGSGSLDVPGIVEAGRGNAEWLVVELDRCDTDMMHAVQMSYRYLVDEGLAAG